MFEEMKMSSTGCSVLEQKQRESQPITRRNLARLTPLRTASASSMMLRRMHSARYQPKFGPVWWHPSPYVPQVQ